MFKLGLPLFYVGCQSVTDVIEIEEDIQQISSDTRQPVELVFRLVSNYKSIPHAIVSWQEGRTEFQFNSFGEIS